MAQKSDRKNCLRDNEQTGADVEAVLKAELTEIDLSREGRLNADEMPTVSGDGRSSGEGEKTPGIDAPREKDSACSQAHSRKLFGLAFSGGGIRSATFNLGVLQGLAEVDLLRFIDYLSTVSGGGYIGSWFTSWVSKNSSVKDVGCELSPGPASSCKFKEPREVEFLREYSNYLTPKRGLFGADIWAVISTYLRNLSLNLAVVLPLLTAILLFPAVAVWISQLLANNFAKQPDMIFNLALIFLGIGVYFINLNLYYVPSKNPETRIYPWYKEQGYILLFIVLPVMLSALMGSFSIWFIQKLDPAFKEVCIVKAMLAYLFAYFAGILTADVLNSFRNRTSDIKDAAVNTFQTVARRLSSLLSLSCTDKTMGIVSGFLSLSAGVGLIACLNYIATRLKDDYGALWYITGFGMPVVIIAYMAVATIQIGFAGRALPDERREWWSRLGGWVLIFTLLWTALFSIAIYGAPLLIWTSRFVSLPLIAGWLMATVSGILAGRGPDTGKPGSKAKKEIVAKAAPYIFIFGLVLFFYFVGFLFCIHISRTWGNFWDPLRTMKNLEWLVGTNLFYAGYILNLNLLWVFLASLAATALFSWRIDINQFSMHLLYRNRLIRCYLGASNQPRSQEPFIGFDTDDDFPLCRLRHDYGYYGPYPIINTALNLVSDRNLAWQQRKAASFVLTPGYCGYDLSVEDDKKGSKTYMPTFWYDRNKGMTVGEAMAISGAAASPNMGYHSSPPLTFLMTIFNLRLGWWCGNTLYEDAWKKASTNWGLGYLIRELFGLTERKSKYVYLSDGGHFENLGLYELVRRRCRTIIVSDAGCDPETKFEDIGNALRKIRIDLGVPIDIDLSLVKAEKAHCATGVIGYKSVDKGEGGEDGTLIYIKPVVCGKEPADVANYRLTHEGFPHQSTADQWFDESQFESYRMLGLHTIRTICKTKGKRLHPYGFCGKVDKYLKELEDQPENNKKQSSEKAAAKTETESRHNREKP